MAVTDNLELPLMSESQDNKATTMNTALSFLERAITETLHVTTTTAVTSGFDIVLPFDDTNDLTDRSALRALRIVLDSGATANFDVIHPDNPHLFILQNDTSRTVTLKTVSGGTSVELLTNANALIYCDGTDMLRLQFTLDTINQYEQYQMKFVGTVASSQVVGSWFVPKDTKLIYGFDGSFGTVGVNPTAAVALAVKINGIQYATINISTAGVCTFTVGWGSGNKTVYANQTLTIEGPATADATLEDLDITLVTLTTVAQT